MFEFLKKIFKNEEELPEEKIPINDLSVWFEDKSKKILNGLNSKIKVIKDRINEEIEKTKQSLETLRNAQLRNTKIPFRAKQVMEGNREAYIKRVDIFLKQIDLERDYNDLLDFCNNFDNMLTDFGKSTIKTYHILQEFFANESSAIAGKIKNLDNLIKEIKDKIKEADIDSIKSIKENIILLNNEIKEREGNKEELEKKGKEAEKLTKLTKEITENIENLKKDEEYERLGKLTSEKDKIIKSIDNHKSKLIHSFSVIEMALKKFSRMAFENEKIIDKYLENSLFLFEDWELKIIKILKDLEENILNNHIQLKDKKKEKTLKEIKKMDKEFFAGFLKEYKELKEKLDEINDEINKIDIQNKINELNKNKKDDELKLGDIEKEIERLKKNIDKGQIDNLKEKIQKNINDLLKIKVIVS